MQKQLLWHDGKRLQTCCDTRKLDARKPGRKHYSHGYANLTYVRFDGLYTPIWPEVQRTLQHGGVNVRLYITMQDVSKE